MSLYFNLPITMVLVLGGSARADSPTPVRIPPQAQNINSNSEEVSDPGALDGDLNANAPAGTRRANKQLESKSLGGSDKDPSARRIERTVEGLTAPGGLLESESGAVGSDFGERNTVAQPSSSVPELHVVQKGDTLWTLCSRYFNDPWRWPRLWAANPAITNPHWIFPGDVVRLLEAGGAAAPDLTTTPSGGAGSKTARLISSNRSPSLSGNAAFLRTLGFIETKDLDQAATITGSREEKIMLATADQAYMRYEKQLPLRAGDRYSVFTTDLDHPVVDPATGKTYGYLVRILGDVVVNQIAENDIARGTLVDTVEPIERGARVSKAVRQFRWVEPKPSNVNLEARVIATFAPNTLLGAENFVVLNRGARDGVQVGNRTFVIRRGDGYRGRLEGWEIHDPNSPKEVVGEIWVVDVREEASVAWIARSNKELRVGELTEMRKGH